MKKTITRYLPIVLDVLAALTLPVLLISASILFTLDFRPLYYSDIRKLDIEAYAGLAESEIRENYDALIDYNSIFGPKNLNLPTLPMSNEGRIHFEEVRHIFVTVEILFIFSLAVTVLLCFIARQRKKDNKSNPYRFLRLGGILSIIIPAIPSLIIAVNWEFFFTQVFHPLLFNNDYWMFSPFTDPVINILPDTFFLHCAVMIISLIIAGAVISYFIGRRLEKKFPGNN